MGETYKSEWKKFVSDSKESLSAMMNRLNDRAPHTVDKFNPNGYADNSTLEINALGSQIKRLMGELDSYAEKCAHNSINDSPYMFENVFEEYAFRERIRVLGKQVDLLKKSEKNF